MENFQFNVFTLEPDNPLERKEFAEYRNEDVEQMLKKVATLSSVATIMQALSLSWSKSTKGFLILFCTQLSVTLLHWAFWIVR